MRHHQVGGPTASHTACQKHTALQVTHTQVLAQTAPDVNPNITPLSAGPWGPFLDILLTCGVWCCHAGTAENVSGCITGVPSGGDAHTGGKKIHACKQQQQDLAKA